MKMRLQPKFIGIGFQRCGTSWLNRVLWEHPEVGKPRSGLHFFNENIRRGVAWYEEELGSVDPGTGIVGEFSTTYCYPDVAKDVATTVARHYPDVRIIASLRQPMDRALSDYRRLLRIGELHDVNIPFHEAIEVAPEIIGRSLYAPVLSEFISRFPRNNIHIILYDNIERSPRDVVARLYKFLAVDDEFVPPSVSERLGATYAMKSVRAERALGLAQSGGRMLKRWLPGPAARSARRFGGKMASSIRSGNRAENEVESWTQSIPYEVVARFKEDIRETATLAAIDLCHWRLK